MAVNNPEQWIKSAKLAVAVAIVRSKPESMTLREYTVQLAESYKQRSQNLRDEKIHEMEEKIALLQRQLEAVDSLNKDNSDPPDFPTPPEAAQPPDNQTSTVNHHIGGLHSAFLTKLTSLKRLLDCDKKPRISAVVRDTVLDFIPRFLSLMKPRLDPLLSPAVAVESVRTLLEVIDKNLMMDNDVIVVENATWQFVVQLWMPVIQDDNYDQSELEKRFICSLIGQLGQCDRLRKVVVIASMKLIDNYCEHLRRLNDPLKVNIVHQENIVRVIDTMEEIIQNSENVDGEFLSAWKCTIENCVLHLSKDYPMMCSALAFLSGLISSKQMRGEHREIAQT